MVLGYCVKCRTKREIIHPKIITTETRTGRERYRVSGTCSKCESNMSLFISADLAKEMMGGHAKVRKPSQKSHQKETRKSHHKETRKHEYKVRKVHRRADDSESESDYSGSEHSD